MMQRHHNATRPELHAFRFPSKGGSQHRGVRRETAEFMEMPLGNPDGLKAFGVGEAGPFDQQLVLARRIGGLVRPEIREAKGERPVSAAAHGVAGYGDRFFALAQFGLAAVPESARGSVACRVVVRAARLFV